MRILPQITYHVKNKSKNKKFKRVNLSNKGEKLFYLFNALRSMKTNKRIEWCENKHIEWNVNKRIEWCENKHIEWCENKHIEWNVNKRIEWGENKRIEWDENKKSCPPHMGRTKFLK